MTLAGFNEIFSNRNIMLMSITVTMLHFARNLFLPWLPLYLKELGTPIPIIGIFFTVRTVLTFSMQSPGGILADRYGRRKTIMVAHAFRLFTPLLYLLANTWEQFIPALIFDAVSHMWSPAVYSTILESLPQKRRTTGFAVIQLLLLSATSLTMLMGGIFVDRWGVIQGIKYILIIEFIFEVIRFTLRYFFLKETLEMKKDKLANTEGTSSNKNSTFSNLKTNKQIWAMIATRCLFQMGFSMANPFIVLFVTDTVGFSKTQWGVIQMCFYLTFALFSIPGGMFADRFSNRFSIILSGIITPVPLFGYIFLKDFNLILFVNIFYGIGAGFGGASFVGPAWQSMLADLVPPERRGKIMGVMNTAAGITSSITPAMGGFFWDIYGPATIFFSAATFETLSVLIFFMFTRPTYERSPLQKAS